MRPSKKKMAMSSANKEDRLSSLPDSVLIAILSLLPIHYAAATSVLSHRWRHLWTHITHLSFAPPRGPTSCYFPQFMTTINHILSQLASSKLHTFHIRYHSPVSHDHLQENGYCLTLLVLWIRLIQARNPEVIKVSLLDVIPVRLFHLPPRFLDSQFLKVLEFDMNIEFKFPADEVINLPNLKKLQLFLYDSHRGLMKKLFKSCPLLQDLDLSLCLKDKYHFVDISAPNLKCLYINMKGSSSNDCKFVIDAPKLEQFKVMGVLVVSEFVKIPSNMQEVIISLEMNSFRNDKVYLSERLGLFRGISCVRSLMVHDCGILMLDSLIDIALPLFRNLVHLSLMCNDGEFEYGDDWSPRIPSCMLAKLKKIDVFDMMGNYQFPQEMKLLNNILSTASVLEQLHVSLYKFYEEDSESKLHQLWNEYIFCKELFTLSRSSLSCEIEFFGNMFNASSKDFSNGTPICQIIA